jgi:hypothetical protein
MDPPLPAGTAPRFKPPLTLLEGRRAGGTARFDAAATSVFSNDDLDVAERFRFTRFEAHLGDRRAHVSLKQAPPLFRGNSEAAEDSYSPASWWGTGSSCVSARRSRGRSSCAPAPRTGGATR